MLQWAGVAAEADRNAQGSLWGTVIRKVTGYWTDPSPYVTTWPMTLTYVACATDTSRRVALVQTDVLLPTSEIKGNTAHLPLKKHCGRTLGLEGEYWATEVNPGGAMGVGVRSSSVLVPCNIRRGEFDVSLFVVHS